ncbi:MAG: ComF family protein [Patescibacteria group bacterium]|jgi:ComF family protein
MLKFSKIKKWLLDIMFPVNCLGCGLEGNWLCPECLNKIKNQTTAVCPVCRRETVGNVCGQCSTKTYLDGLLVCTSYDNVLTQKILHTLKYNYIEEIARILSAKMTDYLDFIDKKDRLVILQDQLNTILVPVPLHPKRQLERGFNQAELLAWEINKKYGFIYKPKLLKRKHYTKPQAQLSRKERLRNLSSVFALTKPFHLSGKNVIIIDDVATTLSTLNECAKVLKKNNCRQVWGLVVARGG